MNKAAILLAAGIASVFQIAQADDGVVVATSRFFLIVMDPCEQPGTQGPTWCKELFFRLIRRSDCREFTPRGAPDIRYCARTTPDEEPTPCQDVGYTFYYGGLAYRARYDRMYAEDKEGKEVWSEVPKVIVTKSPNPSFQRTGNKCELPAAELQR
jgi:hypothetical protein